MKREPQILKLLSGLLTLKAVSIQQLLALLVTLDPTFGASHPLTSYSPQQPLALVAICGRGSSPHLKVVRCGAGYGIDESLQSLLIDVILLQKDADVFSRKSCSSLPEASLFFCETYQLPILDRGPCSHGRGDARLSGLDKGLKITFVGVSFVKHVAAQTSASNKAGQ